MSFPWPVRLGVFLLPAAALALAAACGIEVVGLAVPDAGPAPPLTNPLPVDAGDPRAVVCSVEPCVTEVVVSSYFGCGLMADRTVRCWGSNGQGALGRELPDGGLQTNLPGPVEGVADAVQITAGFFHACALRGDGKVLCWGQNVRGQLGGGPAMASATVVRSAVEVVGLPANVERIHAGGYFTCAHLTDKRVFCWGDGLSGNLGGTRTDGGTFAPAVRRTPIEITALGAVDQLSAGDRFTCARTGGSVSCLGDNTRGQLGRGDAGARSDVVAEVANVEDVSVLFESDSYHTCLLAAGKVMCWGENATGQIAPDAGAAVTVPVEVSGLSDVVEVSPGRIQTCALSAGGTVKCWGSNANGAIGVPPRDGGTIVPTPVDVAGVTNVVRLAVGAFTSCALLKSGTVMCWGAGAMGALGRGGRAGGVPNWTPAPVAF